MLTVGGGVIGGHVGAGLTCEIVQRAMAGFIAGHLTRCIGEYCIQVGNRFISDAVEL
jgi:hypothetical protein